jgi:hypothetical protein
MVQPALAGFFSAIGVSFGDVVPAPSGAGLELGAQLSSGSQVDLVVRIVEDAAGVLESGQVEMAELGVEPRALMPELGPLGGGKRTELDRELAQALGHLTECVVALLLEDLVTRAAHEVHVPP